MTAEERLDQLEPLVAESLAVLDRHTAQLKQLGATVLRIDAKVNTLADAMAQQSDNISFLLHEQTGIKADVGVLKADVGAIKNRLDIMDSKFELIIELLQKPRN